eukprot:6690481-Prorocentrum_lima.AAC.1
MSEACLSCAPPYLSAIHAATAASSTPSPLRRSPRPSSASSPFEACPRTPPRTGHHCCSAHRAPR